MDSELSYLTLIATACATACFMIAVMHLVIWFRTGRPFIYLFSTAMVAAGGCIAVVDLAQLLTMDVSTYVLMSRITHFLLFVLLSSLVAFVRIYLDAGPRWLIYVIVAAWGIIVLVPNLLSPYGVVFSEITELARIETPWGELFTVARGPANPWKYIADFASILILVFVILAAIGAWRNGMRKRAWMVICSVGFFILVAGVLAQLEDAGVVALPLVIPIAFMAIVVALTLQLINEAFKASDASREIQQLRRAITLGEMVGGLAHEINQPLSAILSNAQAARRFLDSPNVDLDEFREIIDDIIADDKRASNTILSLRRMLRRDDTASKTVDVNDAIRAAADMVKGELHTNNVVLRLDLEPNLDAARGDREQLTEVLLNLLLNAIRAMATMPKDRRRVTIGSGLQEGNLLVSVSDRGPGIREDIVTTLFEPFVSKSKDGLGIGLSISKRIVESVGGKIWVEHIAEGGAIFRFTLPRAGTEANS